MGRWMKRASFRAVLRNVEVLLVAGLAGSAAWGQSAVVTYAPGGIAAVPTLADAALLMLVAAVALVAWRWLRWRGGGPGALAVFLLAGLVWCDRVYGYSGTTPQQLMDDYCAGECPLQIGGKASIGKGRVRCCFVND